MYVFLTYADDKFKKSAELLVEEVKQSGLFERVVVATPDLIPKNIRQKISKYLDQPRGGGYWLWKPIVTKIVYDQLKQGDVLFYADAGCSYNDSARGRMEYYLKVVNRNKPILRFSYSNPFFQEDKWTTEEVFTYFSIPAASQIRTTPQFMGGIFSVYKCKRGQKIIDAWYKIAVERPDLFSDDYKNTQKCPRFTDCRHDQSIWSLIAKTNTDYINQLPEEPEMVNSPQIPIKALRRGK